MAVPDDPDALRRRLQAKLEPAAIRTTLAFAGLFQMTHEMLKYNVLEQVRSFYGFLDVDGGVWLPETGEQEYSREVLSLAPGRFQASLVWLQNMDVIGSHEVETLASIWAHRHDLTHELVRYIVDPDTDPSLELLVQAHGILVDISRFWTQVESDIGTFDHVPDLHLDEVRPLNLEVLGMCIRAFAEGIDGGAAEGNEASGEDAVPETLPPPTTSGRSKTIRPTVRRVCDAGRTRTWLPFSFWHRTFMGVRTNTCSAT